MPLYNPVQRRVLGYTSGVGWDARPAGVTGPVVWATADTSPSPALPTDKLTSDVVIKP